MPGGRGMSDDRTPSAQPGRGAAPAAAVTPAGARRLAGRTAALVAATAFAWSVFQLWIASPLPYALAGVVPLPNDTDTRAIHLAAALFLAFLGWPLRRRAPGVRVPAADWALGAAGAVAALYLAAFADSLAARPGLPTAADLAAAAVGLAVVLEASRRVLGPPLAVVALVFLAYVFLGHLAPEVVAWKGASFAKSMSHMWLTQEGVFGIALGVSTDLIFLFVLLGALLERAGAGNWFIWVAFALLGHLRGGPAKAAVVASAATGIVSGSSTANVVTTGTFTIPLMKRVGLSAEKAGAVEVASSTNGQLMPPVMGAAAFLMTEFVGIGYLEVVRHAFLPAAASYVALLYIVHLEAARAGIEGFPRRAARSRGARLLGLATAAAGAVVLSGIVYWGFGWTKGAFGGGGAWVAAALLAGAYLALLRLASRVPDLPPSGEMRELPALGPTVASGLYFLLPVLALVWCLAVERFSAGLSVFWACVLMMAVLLTHKPLKDLMRGRRAVPARCRESLRDLAGALVSGARTMVAIAVATAAAGIVVGTVTLTGIGLVMTGFIEFVSLGNVLLMLVFTAAVCLVLGMGLPTTANYVVVSSLMAPVIVSVGADNGLVVPLVAAHLFVFYFGILADDTPPVGIAAYAAAAISQGRPHPHRPPGVRLRHADGGPAVHVRLQHRAAADRGDGRAARAGGGGVRGRRHAPLRRRRPGLVRHPQPAVGVGGASSRRLHPVPARVLDGPRRPAAGAAAGGRGARRRPRRRPTGRSFASGCGERPWRARPSTGSRCCRSGLRAPAAANACAPPPASRSATTAAASSSTRSPSAARRRSRSSSSTGRSPRCCRRATARRGSGCTCRPSPSSPSSGPCSAAAPAPDARPG